jgi:hypothetical protein
VPPKNPKAKNQNQTKKQVRSYYLHVGKWKMLISRWCIGRFLLRVKISWINLATLWCPYVLTIVELKATRQRICQPKLGPEASDSWCHCILLKQSSEAVVLAHFAQSTYSGCHNVELNWEY